MKGFYHIWAWRPSWSCDPDAVNKLLFPLPNEAPHKNSALIGQAVSEEKMFEIVNDDDGRRTDAGPPVYGLTTTFIEVGCLSKTKCMAIYPFSACGIHSYNWKDTSILSIV